MSLILEALRKSEAERRRGQSPNLYAELPPVARTQRQAMPIWAWLAVGVTALALVLWWLQSLREPPSPAAIVSTASDIASVDVTATVVPKATPPRAIPRAVETPIHPVEPEQKPETTAATPPVATPPAPAPVAEPETAEVAPPPVAAPQPLPAPPPSAPVANDGHLMRLSDLSAEQRKQLPPLRLSMHMWNDASAQRFVIIDGNRYAEGDRIGDAVLESIRSDGVVLDWNGRRLKLPIR